MKLELRAMTKSQRMRESAVMISSTMPSTKYSCSGSPLMFWNGSTAIDGLSGRVSAAAPPPRALRVSPPRMGGRVREGAFRSDAINVNGSSVVFEGLLAEIVEDEVQ